ncbi:MAG: DUF1840 domain-containing protein [Gammaproteobacteria bacterium]|nr:DUF1840 domain-containing protein [Gammaproteobacteria bacterium]MDH3859064.1 DUF1840 domain-containing protein [Gammaproteobacteria bacterium]
MLITFKTTAYANITMFGDIGRQMLEMMAFGTSVPGAINVEDVPQALQNLKQALDKLPEQVEPAGDADDDQPAVSLHTRAVPLVELLQAAVKEETYVRWE